MSAGTSEGEKDMRRRSILRSSAGLLAVVAAALGLKPAAAAETVNIYNARHYGTDQQLWDAFKAKTGIEVNVIDGAHDALIQRMLSEGRNSPADLFITVDAGRLAFAAGKDLLAPTKSAVLESTVPEHLREPDGRWFGLAMRARVLIYAKDRVQPSQLSTYEALADPAFKGKVVVRSSTNVYNLSLVGSILEANGHDKTLAWCEGLVANMARPPEGGDSDQIKAVAAGVGDVAISNTYYLARMAASEKADEKDVAQKVAVFFPNQKDRGTHVNISGAGVVSTAPHKENAVKLLEYLVSPEAQRYFADVSLEYPVNDKVEPHPVLASWGEFNHDTLNASAYAARSADAAMIMDECGWK
jgi:iron(III) transport system substrate-binding protein